MSHGRRNLLKVLLVYLLFRCRASFHLHLISSIVSKMRCLSVKVHILCNYYVYQALADSLSMCYTFLELYFVFLKNASPCFLCC